MSQAQDDLLGEAPLPRDARLAAALRHMPDAHMAPSAEVRAAVLRSAMRALEPVQPAPKTSRDTAGGWWSFLSSGGVGPAALASVFLATVVAGVVYRQADEEAAPAPVASAAPAPPPAPGQQGPAPTVATPEVLAVAPDANTAAATGALRADRPVAVAAAPAAPPRTAAAKAPPPRPAAPVAEQADSAKLARAEAAAQAEATADVMAQAKASASAQRAQAGDRMLMAQAPARSTPAAPPAAAPPPAPAAAPVAVGSWAGSTATSGSFMAQITVTGQTAAVRPEQVQALQSALRQLRNGAPGPTFLADVAGSGAPTEAAGPGSLQLPGGESWSWSGGRLHYRAPADGTGAPVQERALSPAQQAGLNQLALQALSP
jgi:hypothetical protein